MRAHLMLLIASLLAGICCMILHELPKVRVYRQYVRKLSNNDKNQEIMPKINPIHFIDPIGLLFCGMYRIGFSKPCYYRMKEQRLNQKLGFVGLLSLMIQFLLLTVLLRFVLGLDSNLAIPENSSFLYEFFIYFLSSYAIICIGMIITNLFPLLTTDMAWILTSSKPMTFVTLLQNDYLVKMVWLLFVVLRITPKICITIFQLFMGV